MSGNIFEVDLGEPGAQFGSPMYQGLAVSIGGSPLLIATSDTAGNMAIKPHPASGSPPPSPPDRRAQTPTPDDEGVIRVEAGVSDVAVQRAGNPPRVIGLVDPKRIDAMTRTRSRSQELSLLVNEWTAGAWTERTIPLPKEATYCRVVSLGRGAFGLLAGAWDAENPFLCTGTVMDVVDIPSGNLRKSVVTFPDPVQHVSVDALGSFLSSPRSVDRSDGRRPARRPVTH